LVAGQEVVVREGNFEEEVVVVDNIAGEVVAAVDNDILGKEEANFGYFSCFNFIFF
jgi:hypothetical protein